MKKKREKPEHKAKHKYNACSFTYDTASLCFSGFDYAQYLMELKLKKGWKSSPTSGGTLTLFQCDFTETEYCANWMY